MGVAGLILVGIVLILFYKLFFGTVEERKGCWQHVVFGTITIVGLFFWFAHLLSSPIVNEARVDLPIDGKVFGIVSKTTDAATCASYGVPFSAGSLLVTSVQLGSGADRAKLPASIVFDVDGYPPDSPDLNAVKARHQIGDMVPFKLVAQDGKKWRYWVKLGGL